MTTQYTSCDDYILLGTAEGKALDAAFNAGAVTEDQYYEQLDQLKEMAHAVGDCEGPAIGGTK